MVYVAYPDSREGADLRRAWGTLLRNPPILATALALYTAVFAAVLMGAFLADAVNQKFGVAVGAALVLLLGLPAAAAVLGQAAAAVMGLNLPGYLAAVRRSLLPAAQLVLVLGLTAAVLLLIFGMPAWSALDSAARGLTPLSALSPRDIGLLLSVLAVLPPAACLGPALFFGSKPYAWSAFGLTLRACARERHYFYWLCAALSITALDIAVAKAAGLLAPIPVFGLVLMTAVSIAQTVYTSLYLFETWRSASAK